MADEYEVIKEEFIPMTKAKEILKGIEERNYDQKASYEHCKKFSKIEPKKADELMKELSSLEMRKLKAEQIIKIVDMMPQDVDDLKAILMHSQTAFKDEEMQQIIDIVKKYVSK